MIALLRRRTGHGLLACAAAGVLMSSSACSMLEGSGTLTAPCAIVVDASGSGSGFHAEKRIDDTVDHFLEDQQCGKVAFVPLNGLSDRSACAENPLALDPQVGDPDTVRAAMRVQAAGLAHKMLDCARRESKFSDVLGALRQAGDIRPAGDGTYRVLVISDMIQNDGRRDLLQTDMRTPDARARFIAELDKQSLVPHLPDTVVYPTDIGVNVTDATLGQDVRAFWTELFDTDRAGHPTMELRYV